MVAAGITTGLLEKVKKIAAYYQTWRAAGQPAPTLFGDEAIPINCDAAQINFQDPADLYIYCKNYDGNVRMNY